MNVVITGRGYGAGHLPSIIPDHSKHQSTLRQPYFTYIIKDHQFWNYSINIIILILRTIAITDGMKGLFENFVSTNVPTCADLKGLNGWSTWAYIFSTVAFRLCRTITVMQCQENVHVDHPSKSPTMLFGLEQEFTKYQLLVKRVNSQ